MKNKILSIISAVCIFLGVGIGLYTGLSENDISSLVSSAVTVFGVVVATFRYFLISKK